VSDRIYVEVIYALPEVQAVVGLSVGVGTTAAEAITQSRLAERFPHIDLARSRIGIFGKPIKPDAILHDHDRVEIYRSLIADPKEIRRTRARVKRPAKGGS
jgi:putative ubiquitin-RnfH superfamily antitoxin RatB of RatAB toxin-antitoxin module